MNKDLDILKAILLEADEETNVKDKEKEVEKNDAEEKADNRANEKADKPDSPFDKDPMGFILKKYHTLNELLAELMTPDFKEYIIAIFIQAPKPTSFKIVLHNSQFFYLTYMVDDTYQAIISGKRHYLSSIGEKERAMKGISRLLQQGSPLKTKGPDGAEQGTRPEGEDDGSLSGGNNNGGGDQTGAETIPPAEGGEEENKPLTESMILKALIKEANLTASTLFKDIQKTLSDAKYNVTPENKGNRGPVLRTNFETSKNVQGLIEKAISKLLPKDSFKVQEFQKNQGESKSGTYPTYKVQLTKATNGYKKGESVFIVSTIKEGASTSAKDLTPVKLGLTTGKFKTAISLANTIKTNIPNVTKDKNLQNLLDSLVDDVLKGAAKNQFADTAEITTYYQQIPLSQTTRNTLTKVSPQDVGMVGSDFGECLGAIALLKSVVNKGSGLTFPAAEANPLADFQLDGFNVSSKYNKGGAATITDTVKNIKPEQLTTPGQESLYELLKIIISKDGVQGPLMVAKALKLEGLQKLSEIIKVPSEDIDQQKINDYLTKILKSATTDEQKESIIKKKFGSFFQAIKKAPGFPIRWRDISPKAYYGIVTSPLANYVAASLNTNKTYKKALTDIMSKLEVKQLYLTMNVKKNTASFNLKSFSSSEFEFEASLSIYNPKNKRLAFRML
jgi:hypothetical protein